MGFKHADPGAKRVVETVTPRLDPEHDPDDGEVEKEDDVGDVAVGKSDRDDGGAAGDGPVGRDVEPLPPDHDAGQLAPVKMGHRVDVTRIVKALLPRNRCFVGGAGIVLSCHECLDNSITRITPSIQSNAQRCPMPALLSDILDPKLVVLDLREQTAAEAILEIVERLRDHGLVEDFYKLADAVMEREGRTSTNTGEGVAFPHARTDLVDRLVLGIGRSKNGIPFGFSSEPVHLIFLVGVPQRMVTDYLVCLGALARVVKDKGRRDALMAVTTGEEFVELMREASLQL